MAAPPCELCGEGLIVNADAMVTLPDGTMQTCAVLESAGASGLIADCSAELLATVVETCGCSGDATVPDTPVPGTDAPETTPAPDPPTDTPMADPTSAPMADPTDTPMADPTSAPVEDPTPPPVEDPTPPPAEPPKTLPPTASSAATTCSIFGIAAAAFVVVLA